MRLPFGMCRGACRNERPHAYQGTAVRHAARRPPAQAERVLMRAPPLPVIDSRTHPRAVWLALAGAYAVTLACFVRALLV